MDGVQDQAAEWYYSFTVLGAFIQHPCLLDLRHARFFRNAKDLVHEHQDRSQHTGCLKKQAILRQQKVREPLHWRFRRSPKAPLSGTNRAWRHHGILYLQPHTILPVFWVPNVMIDYRFLESKATEQGVS